MSKLAWAYIIGILLGATLLGISAWQQAEATLPQLMLLAILIVITTGAHLFEAKAPDNQTYYPSMIFLFVGVLLLPPGMFVLLALMPHLVEWVRERLTQGERLRAWYLQPFNIATHIIAGISALVLYTNLLRFDSELPLGMPVLAAICAALAYVLINHAVIGLALLLARNISWQQSGVLSIESILPDFVNLCLGFVVARLWYTNPWLILPVLSPIVLIYRALTVPQLKQEAQTDMKTGLLNARYFNKLFLEEYNRAERFDRPLSVIIADLDLMRNINNTYGHLAGDVVLAGIGEVLRANVRHYDLAARFGGEEFCIALPETDPAAAMQLAERIRVMVEAIPFTVSTSDTPIHATMSMGVACYPQDGANTTELMHAADVAVYQAKLSGRNRVVYTGDVPHSVTIEQMKAAGAVKERLQANATAPAPAVPETPPAPVAQPVVLPPAPSIPSNLRPHPLFWLFTSGVSATGLGVALWGLAAMPQLDGAALVLLMGLTVIAELLQINVYEHSTFSVSVALVFAAALVLGIPGVVAVCTVIVLVHYSRQRPKLYTSLFNWATHIIGGVAPVLAFQAAGVPLSLAHLLRLLPVLAIAGVMHFLIESGLFATFISLKKGSTPSAHWRQQFGWMIGHYLILCIMGVFMAIAYTSFGTLGVLLFSLPAIMMRFAQKQYTERTADSIRELRRLNNELSRANGEVVAASRSMQQLNDELFLTLAKIIDARDPYAAGHASKVADYALLIARELNLPPEQQAEVYQAGLLHDIGKIGIPEEILNKPSKLSVEEYSQVKLHARLGADFLETCHSLRHLSAYVRHHHERWDGAGYPDALAGDEIPLIARILNVCDSIEAMASDRPYHRGLSPERVISEVQGKAGQQFDPAIVEVFVNIIERDGLTLISNSALEVLRKSQAANRALAPEPVKEGIALLPAPAKLAL